MKNETSSPSSSALTQVDSLKVPDSRMFQGL